MDIINKMTLADLITKYAGLVHRNSALELKQNPVFMRECRENEEFQQYVIDHKPTITTVRLPSVKFKHPGGTIIPATAQIDAECVPVAIEKPVEKI
jgi:hypothetical protein